MVGNVTPPHHPPSVDGHPFTSPASLRYQRIPDIWDRLLASEVPSHYTCPRTKKNYLRLKMGKTRGLAPIKPTRMMHPRRSSCGLPRGRWINLRRHDANPPLTTRCGQEAYPTTDPHIYKAPLSLYDHYTA